MAAMGQHIMLRLSDDRVIAPTTGIRRMVSRTVLRLARNAGLLAFRCVDTHLHMSTLTSREKAGRLAQAVESSLVQRLALSVSFSRAHFKDIAGQHHLERLFHYILDQERHHGVSLDPFHEASVLQDLSGLRTVGSYVIKNVRSYLPRIGREQLLRYLDQGVLDRSVETHEGLSEAAASASGLPNLEGNSPATVAARSAAVAAASGSLSSRAIGSLLNVHQRTVQRLANMQPDPALILATDLQLRLRQPAR